MADESRARMRREGIEILTLARDTDPEKYRKLWKMSDEAEQDIPTTVPHTGTTWEVFEEWMRSPGLRPERQWIAREHQQANPADLSGVLVGGTFHREDRRVEGQWPIPEAFVKAITGGAL